MLTVQLDIAAFTRQLDDIQKTQVAFATMKALNKTAVDFQAAERKRIEQQFTLRRRDFILRTVKIERGNFATKDNLRAIVNIDENRNVLAKFEAGGVKRPQSGVSIAIPVAARRNKADIVTRGNRPKALQLMDIARRGAALVAKGERRTFLIRKSDGTGGIFQRFGRKASGSIRELFAFKPLVPIPKRLGFHDTAVAVVTKEFAANWQQAFEYAMKTARK